MESFLKYEFNVLPPNSFLSSWTKYPPSYEDILNLENKSSISTTSPLLQISNPTSQSMEGWKFSNPTRPSNSKTKRWWCRVRTLPTDRNLLPFCSQWATQGRNKTLNKLKLYSGKDCSDLNQVDFNIIVIDFNYYLVY